MAVGGWSEWANRVLSEQERNEKDHGEFRDKFEEIRVELAVLKTKAAMIGFIAGGAMGIIGSVATWLITK